MCVLLEFHEKRSKFVLQEIFDEKDQSCWYRVLSQRVNIGNRATSRFSFLSVNYDVTMGGYYMYFPAGSLNTQHLEVVVEPENR